MVALLMQVRLSRKILKPIASKLRITVQRLELYRDLVASFGSLVAVILGIFPLLGELEKDPADLGVLITSFLWLVLAVGISRISPHSNEILAAAAAFLALRGVFALVVHGANLFRGPSNRRLFGNYDYPEKDQKLDRL
jgi:hypothetical protein